MFTYLIFHILPLLAGGSSAGRLDEALALFPPDVRRLRLLRIGLVNLLRQLKRKCVDRNGISVNLHYVN